jgi:hypothetical protein
VKQKSLNRQIKPLFPDASKTAVARPLAASKAKKSTPLPFTTNKKSNFNYPSRVPQMTSQANVHSQQPNQKRPHSLPEESHTSPFSSVAVAAQGSWQAAQREKQKVKQETISVKVESLVCSST